MSPAGRSPSFVPPRPFLWGLVGVVALAMAAYAASVLGLVSLPGASQRVVPLDYLAFYMAGDVLNQHGLDELYDQNAQIEYQRRFVTQCGAPWTGYCPYLNPPHYAAAMSLLSPFGFAGSLAAWWLVSLGCFAGTCRIWWQWLGRDQARVAIALVVCTPSWIMTFVAGQNTFISLFVLTLGCHLLMKRRDTWAGLVLALLAYKFHLLLVPVGVLLFKRRWRALAGLAVGGLMTLAATAVLFDPAGIVLYARQAAHFGDLMQSAFATYKQHSWYGFFETIAAGRLSATTVRMLTVLASLGCLGLLLRTWRGGWLSGDGADDTPQAARFSLQLSALVVAIAVTSPHLFHYDTLLLTLAAVLWVRAARDPALARATRAVPLIMLLGFAWLSIAVFVTAAVPFQLSTPLMLAWLIVLARAPRAARVDATATLTVHPT